MLKHVESTTNIQHAYFISCSFCNKCHLKCVAGPPKAQRCFRPGLVRGRQARSVMSKERTSCGYLVHSALGCLRCERSLRCVRSVRTLPPFHSRCSLRFPHSLPSPQSSMSSIVSFSSPSSAFFISSPSSLLHSPGSLGSLRSVPNLDPLRSLHPALFTIFTLVGLFASLFSLSPFVSLSLLSLLFVLLAPNTLLNILVPVA